MKTRTIVIPLDDTSFSHQVLPAVSELFDPPTDRLILVRVAEPAHGLIGQPPRPIAITPAVADYGSARNVEYAAHPIYESQQEESDRALFEQELTDARLMMESAGFKVTLDVRFGDPADEIVACAHEHHANLVAMATHNGSVMRQLLLGSVTERVLQRIDIPIMLVRP